MTTLYLILLIVAFICFLLGAAAWQAQGRASRVNLVALGLAVWVLVPLIQTFRVLTR